jgi:hypothetical protein
MLTFYWEGDLGMLSRKATRVVRDFTCDSRRWTAYKPREGDVIIATAPKVGTTWMQQIVCLLIFQSPEPRQLAKLSPWIDSRFRGPVEQMLDSIEAQTHRRFLKSHLPLDALPIYDEVKYIHVAREGRDACMSLLNHYSSFSQEALEGFDRIGLSDETINRPFPRTPKGEREFFLYWIADSQRPAPRSILSPRIAGGFKNATSDEAKIRKWWQKWPDANIGVALSANTVVLDFDCDPVPEWKELIHLSLHGYPIYAAGVPLLLQEYDSNPI